MHSLTAKKFELKCVREDETGQKTKVAITGKTNKQSRRRPGSVRLSMKLKGES